MSVEVSIFFSVSKSCCPLVQQFRTTSMAYHLGTTGILCHLGSTGMSCHLGTIGIFVTWGQLAYYLFGDNWHIMSFGNHLHVTSVENQHLRTNHCYVTLVGSYQSVILLEPLKNYTLEPLEHYIWNHWNTTFGITGTLHLGTTGTSIFLLSTVL